MKRSLLLTCAGVLACLPLMAQAQDSNPYDGWTGWHAGIQLGVNHNSYDGFGSSNAMTTTLEGGYEYRAGLHLVLGGSLFSDWNSDTSHDVRGFPGVSANFGSHVYGVDFMAGFPVNNFLPFVKLGYGHVSLSGDLSGSDNSARYGAGVIWRLDPNSGVVFQYMYQKATIPNAASNGDFKNGNLTVGYDWFFSY